MAKFNGTELDELAREIVDAYHQLEMICYDTSPKINKNPDWVKLPNGKTLRNQVLLERGIEGERELIVCPASFTITSDSAAIHLDHFYPKTSIYKNIDKIFGALEKDGMSNFRGKLVTCFVGNGKDKKAAETLVGELLLKSSIKRTKKSKKPHRVTSYRALKTLFHNDVRNLWPIAGGVNLRANAKAHEGIISDVWVLVSGKFLSMRTDAIKQLSVGDGPDNTLAKELIGIYERKLPIGKEEDVIKQKIETHFQMQVGRQKKHHIIPRNRNGETALEIYQASALSALCSKLAEDLQKQLKRAFTFSIKLVRGLNSSDRAVRRTAIAKKRTHAAAFDDENASAGDSEGTGHSVESAEMRVTEVLRYNLHVLNQNIQDSTDGDLESDKNVLEIYKLHYDFIIELYKKCVGSTLFSDNDEIHESLKTLKKAYQQLQDRKTLENPRKKRKRNPHEGKAAENLHNIFSPAKPETDMALEDTTIAEASTEQGLT